MKLASYSVGHGNVRVGLVVAQHIIDLSRHVPEAPTDMIGLITQWPTWKETAIGLAAQAIGDFALADVRFHAPVVRPGKIFGIGLNYADHIVEAGMAKPTEQVWFAKAGTSTQSPFATIALPRVSTQLDYEAELAFVIGRRCKHVPVDKAHEVIFGYCAANDVSVRDWQLKSSQFVIGKSFDTHCPYGPWIVTPDEVGDPHRLGIRTTVNGELRQCSNTRELIFNCFEQVAFLSQAMTLEPGDLFLSGTPGGVGMGFKPPRWLRADDVVRVEIENIGAIENRVAPEQESLAILPDATGHQRR